ncbi:vesicle coat component [Elasticomyces elasticus]|nr:vesicle coat component [Elasticomyces elasticus]KAK3666599.1 vesicle coat component [Elasticomyces elasticus]KAK4928268.1 vesicle coat component [Elasticomyces elasticus]KAK5763831.1 vesicle coat component [Elasticomyces elasticus]
MDSPESPFPNFGNAYPTSATDSGTKSASWNPALRSHNQEADLERVKTRESDGDDEFFERYPGATPKKVGVVQDAPVAEDEEDENEEEDNEDEEIDEDFRDDVMRRGSIAVERRLDITSDLASPEDLARGARSSFEVEAPLREHAHDSDEGVAAVTPAVRDEEAAGYGMGDESEDEEREVFKGPDDSREEQERNLEDYMPEGDAHEAQDARPRSHDSTEDPMAHPEDTYEHQGEVTELEAAIDEEPDAPLLEDEEALPTAEDARVPLLQDDHDEEDDEDDEDDDAASPTQSPSRSRAAPPGIDRSFTTNFTEPPQPSEHSRELESMQEEPRPSTGDDETFGELLGDAPPSHVPAKQDTPDDQTFGQLLDDEQSEAVVPQIDLWSATKDDDDPFAQLASSQPPQQGVEADGAAESTLLGGDGDDFSAAWQAALDDDELLDDSNDLDPLGLLDDDELLEDDEDDEAFLSQPPQPLLLPHHQQQVQQQPPAQQNRGAQYRPQQQQQSQSRSSPYNPSSTFTSQQHHGRGVGTPDTGLFDILNTQPSPPINQTPFHQTQQQQQPQRPGLQGAQSFADKSKGGYQSPYDLPMDVVKPRRRARGDGQQQSVGGMPKPPPRSSSFGTPSNPALQQQQRPEIGQQAPPRPGSGASSNGSASGGPNGVPSARSTPKMAGNGFFEDLPMAPKPRVRGFTPQPSALGLASPPLSGPPGGATRGYTPSLPSTPGLASPAPRGPSGMMSPPLAVQPHMPPQQSQQQQQQGQPVYGGLRQPERLPLLPDHPIPPTPIQAPAGGYGQQQAPSTMRAPPAASRYSPAPVPQANQQQHAQPQQRQQQAPGPPPSQPTRVPSAHQYAPRTSSPLAQPSLDKPQPPIPIEAVREMTMSPPQMNGGPADHRAGLSPERKSRYSPAEPATQRGGYRQQQAPPTQSHAPPPPRPRTQSPSSTMKQARMIMTQVERPTSAAGAHYAAVPLQTTAVPQPQHYQPQQQQQQQQKTVALPHRRQFSRDLTFAAPTDVLSQDPLERWKGSPLFSWNAAGTILTSFPKQTPFYASGQGGPSIKCTPGDIRIQDAAVIMPMDDRDAKFPGPLASRTKGKKKEVLAWMTGKIEDLARWEEGVKMDFKAEADLKKRCEEKVLLWRVMKVFVENDGAVEGSAKIDEEVRKLLLPNLAQMNAAMELQTPVSAGGSNGLSSEGVDKTVLSQIRQALLEGQRERAVWLAEEKKLWGHAMIIASTMGPETWKQIIQAFVRSNVKSVGADGRSLAALYQIFAGNSEDCVDELVPPSARAGFQMVNAADGTASGNPLDGLDHWRETLGLVASNRTANDGASLVALGKLLNGYGRVEAAGVCFLLARAFAKHSGADDTEAHFVLLGGDGQGSAGAGPGGEMDPIMLTEIFEWASSLATPAPAVLYIPHLQAYKLLHAQELAAHGLKAKAQGYCDHITSAYTSTTRPSQYYHPIFTQAVADLSAFLSQTPHTEGKGGLFSRPAMKTVSSGAASWFTKFVSGEDDQSRNATAGTVGSGGDDSGPFGRVSGELSRSGSVADLYNPAMMGGPIATPGPAPMASFMPSTASQGRYAPSYGAIAAQKPLPMDNQQTPTPRYTPQFSSGQSLMEGTPLTSPTEVTRSLGVPSLEQQQQRPMSAPRSVTSRYAPSPSGGFGLGVQRVGSLDVPRPEASRAASDYGVPYASSVASDSASRRGSAQYPGSQGSYEPSPSLMQEPSAYGYQPSPLQQPYQPEDDIEDAFGPKTNGLAGYETNGIDAEGGGYEPPAAAYEPPSYQPYQPDAEDEEEVAPRQQKKKGVMDLDDDDDEIVKRAAALKKAQADRAADEAFRKAAEADAEKDGKSKGGDKKASGSWLGGWFKKDATAELNKPVRAKLGEESSFVYDEQLKKWVNKKGGPEAATPVAATPPPPRGPGSRMASSASGPPLGPPSRVASAAGFGGNSRPPTSGSGGPSMVLPGSGPPSRAASPASFQSAAPPGSAGLAPPSALAAAFNGDISRSTSAPPPRPATSMSTASSLDDLLAGPRKAGGTVKGKKKGRYIDVMAK